jgi:hypothetical protein
MTAGVARGMTTGVAVIPPTMEVPPVDALDRWLAEDEKKIIVAALRQCKWHFWGRPTRSASCSGGRRRKRVSN